MASPNVKNIFETTDYQGRIVTLTEERFRHIKQGRVFDDTTKWPDAIRNTVESPDLVVAGDYVDTEIFCKEDAGDETTKGKWMNVPVSYQMGFGSVRTAMLSNRPKKQNRKLLHIRPGLFE